ncbi:MAG: nucleoside kinase [Kiritimatiellae bacterium]|nr:nucleoside kinase [Kiritimatiellia bacterium]
MTIDELNASIQDGTIDDLIMVCEARQIKALSHIADRVSARRDVRLLLVAGGSSAGKTTTSKRLVTQLAVNGIKSLAISTDDYFVGDKYNPRDENGQLDYEHLKCVDADKLTRDIKELLAGRPVLEHRFDFAKHEPYDTSNMLSLPAGGIIVIEGIHALNPALLPNIDDSLIHRVFVEPKGQPMVFAKTRLAPRMGRLLRRMVRDNRYRKMSPIDTLNMWPKVIAGEEKWIDPFRKYADDEFDSALGYELAVLKPFAEGLLLAAEAKLPDSVEIHILKDVLQLVKTIGPAKVPGDSIIRETIGGSLLEY